MSNTAALFTHGGGRHDSLDQQHLETIDCKLGDQVNHSWCWTGIELPWSMTGGSYELAVKMW